jgi:hypothetical protein
MGVAESKTFTDLNSVAVFESDRGQNIVLLGETHGNINETYKKYIRPVSNNILVLSEYNTEQDLDKTVHDLLEPAPYFKGRGYDIVSVDVIRRTSVWEMYAFTTTLWITSSFDRWATPDVILSIFDKIILGGDQVLLGSDDVKWKSAVSNNKIYDINDLNKAIKELSTKFNQYYDSSHYYKLKKNRIKEIWNSALNHTDFSNVKDDLGILNSTDDKTIILAELNREYYTDRIKKYMEAIWLNIGVCIFDMELANKIYESTDKDILGIMGNFHVEFLQHILPYAKNRTYKLIEKSDTINDSTSLKKIVAGGDYSNITTVIIIILLLVLLVFLYFSKKRDQYFCADKLTGNIF